MSFILVVTGASGAGKTALVRGLESRHLPDVRYHYFDSVGVPTPERMVAEFGPGEEWQRVTTRRWIAELAADRARGRVSVLDGQVRPSEVRAAFARSEVSRGEILLVDCDPKVREARLVARNQPELATADMRAWAAYLRGQADALHLPILDTTKITVEEGVEELVTRIREWTGSSG